MCLSYNCRPLWGCPMTNQAHGTFTGPIILLLRHSHLIPKQTPIMCPEGQGPDEIWDTGFDLCDVDEDIYMLKVQQAD